MILYERRMVLGHPCKSLVPSQPWELLVLGVLEHPWKWRPCLYHGHPWKWVQGIFKGVALETACLTWVGMILLWDGLLDMPQLFSIFQILHRQLQIIRVGNCRGLQVHL